MTQALTFGQSYISAVTSLINTLDNLRLLQDRIAQDSNLLQQYVGSAGARADLDLTTLNNAASAVTQILFTFDSGAPTQKSYLFKLL